MCKYRKQLLVNEHIDSIVKEIFKDIESKSDFIIDIVDSDKDHIHLLVSYPPKISISSIVRKLKQESTIMLWKYFPVYLSKHFWKQHTFWLEGYFQLKKQNLKLLEDIMKIKVNSFGIHPID